MSLIMSARRGAGVLVRRQVLFMMRPTAAVPSRGLSDEAPMRKPGSSKGPNVIYEPEGAFEPRKTGFLDAIDRLGTAMFMGEIFRGIWLSMEV